MLFATALVGLAAAGPVLSAPMRVARRHDGAGPKPHEHALYRRKSHLKGTNASLPFVDPNAPLTDPTALPVDPNAAIPTPDPALPDPALVDPTLVDPALVDPALADPALADPLATVLPIQRPNKKNPVSSVWQDIGFS